MVTAEDIKGEKYFRNTAASEKVINFTQNTRKWQADAFDYKPFSTIMAAAAVCFNVVLSTFELYSCELICGNIYA